MPCVPDPLAAVAMTTVVGVNPTVLRSMGDNFRGERAKFGSQEMLTGLILVASVAVGIWLLSRGLNQRDRRQPYNRPRKLFGQLCAAHGLDRKRRVLLQQLAHAQGLQQPALLFIEAERFDRARLGPSLAGCEKELFELRDRLFADHTLSGTRDAEVPSPGQGRRLVD